MKTDVLDHITTAILSQKNELLTFMFKKMIVVKQNYEITKKKMLIII